jgi:feruloyl-CoA synthase
MTAWEAGMKDNTTGLTLVPHAVNIERRAEDLLMTNPNVCDPVVSNTGVWLDKWADEAPSRVFLAERSNEGWREMGYAEVRDAVRAIASSLAARGMDGSTPIVIMSGNSIDHALLSLGAQYAGVPTVPLAEQYSLITEAHERLVYVLNKIKPAMAFVDNASRYGARSRAPSWPAWRSSPAGRRARLSRSRRSAICCAVMPVLISPASTPKSVRIRWQRFSSPPARHPIPKVF